MEAWIDDKGRIQIALNPDNREFEAIFARVWFKRVTNLYFPEKIPGRAEWTETSRLVELDAAISGADRVHTARHINRISQEARKWSKNRRVESAQKYIELKAKHPKRKRGELVKEATGLANSTDAAGYVVDGLNELAKGKDSSGAIGALSDFPRKDLE